MIYRAKNRGNPVIKRIMVQTIKRIKVQTTESGRRERRGVRGG
jgi:hypothetical protein